MTVFPFLTLVVAFPSETHRQWKTPVVMLHSVSTGNSVSECMAVYGRMWGLEGNSFVRICHEKHLLYWEKKACGLTDWRRKKKSGFSSQRNIHTQACAHTHTRTHKYINTAAPSLWKQGINTGYSLIAPGSRFCRPNGNREEVSKKRVREGENYSSLCHCLLMSWKPADHIALAEMVQRTQTLRHGISSMWKVLGSYVTVQKKENGNK